MSSSIDPQNHKSLLSETSKTAAGKSQAFRAQNPRNRQTRLLQQPLKASQINAFSFVLGELAKGLDFRRQASVIAPEAAKGGAMDDDHRDLANHLFATATAMLEDAIDLAVAGQSRKLSSAELVRDGQLLTSALQDIAIVARAATIIAGRPCEGSCRHRQ